MDFKTQIVLASGVSALAVDGLLVVLASEAEAQTLDKPLAAELAKAIKDGDFLCKPGHVLYGHRVAGVKAARVGFAFAGAWMILPFSGLEVLALGWALYYVSCHANDYECIVISGSSMVVEIRNHRAVRRVEFQRYWVHVVVLPASLQGRCRVWVRARGQEAELGKFVNDDERMALASQLKMQTGAGYRV